jgi:hypothetical protein
MDPWIPQQAVVPFFVNEKVLAVFSAAVTSFAAVRLT